MTYIINETGKYRRIETLFTTPDGDQLDLYYKRNKDGDDGTLTDLGVAIDWIATMTVNDELIAAERQHLIETCLANKIAYQNGMFLIPIKYLDDLPEAVTRLGEALMEGLAEQDERLRATYNLHKEEKSEDFGEEEHLFAKDEDQLDEV